MKVESTVLNMKKGLLRLLAGQKATQWQDMLWKGHVTLAMAEDTGDDVFRVPQSHFLCTALLSTWIPPPHQPNLIRWYDPMNVHILFLQWGLCDWRCSEWLLLPLYINAKWTSGRPTRTDDLLFSYSYWTGVLETLQRRCCHNEKCYFRFLQPLPSNSLFFFSLA